jgi:hypothetical protein
MWMNTDRKCEHFRELFRLASAREADQIFVNISTGEYFGSVYELIEEFGVMREWVRWVSL